MKVIVYAALAVSLLSASAGAVYYDIGKNGDNKINVSWESVATLETMIGRTTKATGFAYFDDKGSAHMIHVTIPVTSIKTGIEMRDEHMASENWLDAAKFPNIEFKSVQIRKTTGTDRYTITGDMTIHGVTKRITVTGVAKRHPAKPALERSGYVGDILHLKTIFTLKLTDYGVKVPDGMMGVKISENLTINFDIFALTNNDPGRTPPTAAKPAVMR